MSLTTGLIIGLGLAGGLGGVHGCSSSPSPKYQINDCVRSVDSFGEFDSEFIRKIININDKDYKYNVYSPANGWFYTSTSDIGLINKYYKKVDCP